LDIKSILLPTFLFLILFSASRMPAVSAALKIEETKFFVRIYTTSKDGFEITQDFDTTLVPLVPYRSCYGWQIKVPTDAKLIKLREEFMLPNAPSFWSGESDEFATNRIVNNRRTSITKRFVIPDDGWVENAWCVVKGDPEGDYSIKVYLNNQFIKKFDFEIRKLPKKN